MNFLKCLKHAFNMIAHSPLRSWLTILGIVIGVGAVIAIMSLGTGMQEQLSSRLGSLGGDILTISAGFERGAGFGGGGPGGMPGEGGRGEIAAKQTNITRFDVQTLKSIYEVALISPSIRGSVDSTYLDKTGSVSVTGVDPAVWPKITTSTLATGRMFDATDQNVIIIGGRLASSYFSKPIGVNQMLNLGGTSLRVVGILDDESNSVYVPMQMAYQLLTTKTQGVYDSITVKVRDQNELDAAIEKITSKLMLSRHVTTRTKDFTVTSSKAMQATFASTMSSMNLFLLAIAAVSLIVGAVGIANTMFTSVLERTKEIGIMKAIGARNQDILKMFVLMAAGIGLIGGLIGVVFGVVLSWFLPALMGTASMLTRGGTIVSIDSVIVALVVSLIAGVIAGIIPAYNASKLKPVDALRYE